MKRRPILFLLGIALLLALPMTALLSPDAVGQPQGVPAVNPQARSCACDGHEVMIACELNNPTGGAVEMLVAAQAETSVVGRPRTTGGRRLATGEARARIQPNSRTTVNIRARSRTMMRCTGTAECVCTMRDLQAAM